MYAMQAFLLITLLIGSADAGVLRSKSNRANVAKDAPDDRADVSDMLSAVEKELQKGSALSDKIPRASVDEKLAGENKDEDDGFDDLNGVIAKVAADQKHASSQGVVVAAPKPVVKSNQENVAEGTQVDSAEKSSEHRYEADFHNLAKGIVDEQKGLLAKVAQAGRLNAVQKVSEKSLTGVGSDRKVVEEKSVKGKAMTLKAVEATEELAKNIQQATAKAVAKSNGRVGKVGEGGMTGEAGSSKQQKAEGKDKAGQDLAKQIVKAAKAVDTKTMALGQKTAAKETVAVRVVTDPAVAEVEAQLLGEGVKTTEAELLEAGMKALEKRKESEQEAKAAALKKAEAQRMAKAAAGKAAAKRKADEKAEADRKATVKATVRKALDKKRAAEKATVEKMVAAKAAAERAAEKERKAEKLAADKRTAKKVAAEKKALAEKLALAAAEKAKAEKKAAEEAHEAAEKATQDAAEEDTAAEDHSDDGDDDDDDPAHDTEETTESEFEAEDRNAIRSSEAASDDFDLKMKQQWSNQEYGENDNDEHEPEQMEEDSSASQDVVAETDDSDTEGEDEGDADQESF